MRYAAQRAPLAIAHRGGAALAPENTLAAFGRASALGLGYLETDLRLSADGELVCFHDETLDRVSDGRGPVRSRTLAQLRSVRVGGEPIVTLAEALETFPRARFSVDLKERDAIEPLAHVLRRPADARRVCVAGAWDGWLAQVQRLVPEVSCALGWRSLTTLITCAKLRVPSPRWIRTAEFAHVPVHLGRIPIFADRLVEHAHAHGIRVIVWTVDDPELMDRLLDAGVDGIITDRPDLLREAYVRRGIWQPMGSSSSRPWDAKL